MLRRLFILLLIVGCVREYECDLIVYYEETSETITNSVIEGERYTSYNMVSVDWPKGEKDAEEICADSHRDETLSTEMGVVGTVQGCSCNKR